ncbi:sulfatase-like hydrolase/transferase [Kribbella sp. NPDC049227]|uniref:sulfatase-like hydrolase/transferase n=1 Tax=Kribbella sp. NPDC049227 TaxID=3364113 RepID=UPI0037206865
MMRVRRTVRQQVPRERFLIRRKVSSGVDASLGGCHHEAIFLRTVAKVVPKSPNILFLMSDEHRYDVAGFAGDAVIRTPTLDWLAGTGAVFGNAYTPSPVCIPARQSLMSGQLPRTTGCLRYGQDLPPGHETFARTLARHGYATVACGKLHHRGVDQMQGWTRRIGSDITIGADAVDSPAAEFAERVPSLAEVKWSDAKEVKRAGIGRGPLVAQDEYTLTGALDFIEEFFTDPYYDRPSRDQPVLLKVSLNQPHYPYFAGEERFTHYLNRVTPYLNQAVSDHPFLAQRQVRPGIDATEVEIRRATAAYYAMVENADAMFGQVLRALQHQGQDLDDWVIVYTADHGEMLGQHGIWEKQKFYEASARVPLIIRSPQHFSGGHLDENVNLCDLYATLCELAGHPAPDGLDSRSLVPLMRREPTDWSGESVSHFGDTNLMIKQDNLKYQYYGEAMPEVLFDLEADPSEQRDFIAAPEYRELVERFRTRRAALGYGPDADPDYRNAGYTEVRPMVRGRS